MRLSILAIGPEPIATVLGLMATIEHSPPQALAFGAILAVTYGGLVFATRLTRTLEPHVIDAATRIVGFFVSAMGVSLVFSGVIDALKSNGVGAYIRREAQGI
ncbi:MAG: MarC family protein [Methylocystis sp.]